MAEVQNVYIIRIEDVFIHASNRARESGLSSYINLTFSQFNPYQKYIESVLGKHDYKTIWQSLRCFNMRYCYFINKTLFINFFNFLYDTKNKLVLVSKGFLTKEDVLSFLQYHGVNPNADFHFLRYNQESILTITENYRGFRWNKYVTVIDNDLKSVFQLRKRGFNAFYADNFNPCSSEGKKYINFLSKNSDDFTTLRHSKKFI